MRSRNRLYSILLTACLAGYGWIAYATWAKQAEVNSAEVCIVKHVTSVPCPSCGTTRSLLSISQGDFVQALLTNPLGYVGAGILLIVPVWIIFDLLLKRSTLQKTYFLFEAMLRKPRYAFSFALLILLNWIWNITKGL